MSAVNPMTPTEIVLKAILDRRSPDPASLPPPGSYPLDLSLRIDGDSVRLCGVLDGQVMMVRLGKNMANGAEPYSASSSGAKKA